MREICKLYLMTTQLTGTPRPRMTIPKTNAQSRGIVGVRLEVSNSSMSSGGYFVVQAASVPSAIKVARARKEAPE
jgi:hypothetical protein